jgi:hypothetical protein
MNEQIGKVTGGESFDEQAISPEMSLISIPERGISIEKELAEIEKNVAFFNKVKIIALKMTKPSDWVDLGGNPYLMDRGAQNIAIAFGVDITQEAPRMEWAEDANGRYYMFITSGRAHAKKLGRFIEDVGVCSQRDKFFGMSGGKLKEIQDVDMANVIRKASTNLYNRLVKRVIGLSGVTWDDLGAAGIKRESLQKVEYKAGSQKSSDLTTGGKDTKAKMDAMLLKMANNDKAAASELLKKFSYWKGNDEKEHFVTSSDQLTEKWLNSTYGRVKTEYEKTMSGGEREPGQEG